MTQVFHDDPENDLPWVPAALVEHLERKFPLEGYKNIADLQGLHTYQGAQEIITYLRALLQTQSKEAT